MTAASSTVHNPHVPQRSALRIAVIGAGPAGLATGHELLAHGFDNFTIFEATDAVGGTWHLHSYPGLACDVWAHAYTFSYRPNPEWTASFVDQPEIEAYLQRCASEFGLDPHITLNTRIASAHYQDDGFWRLETTTGERFDYDVIINAMGNQHTPRYPNVPGINEFQGASFHGTRWDHSVELTGKRVVVVGSAASAVQIVPEVAKVAGELTVLQRSPNWIMPRRRKFYTDAQRDRWRRFPVIMKAIRRVQQFLMSMVHDAATLGHNRAKQFEKRARAFINDAIPDPQLRAALTPTDPYGCKRGLVSDDFYPALMRESVELIPEGLRAVRPTGITTENGREIDADVIIFCTGYRILDYDRITIVGATGQSLADAMSTSTEAFKGIAVPDFPNYFFAVGPNGLPLDAPYFVTAECNIATIVGLLRDKQAAGVRSLAVKPAVSTAYNRQLAKRFPRYSWASPSCSSYYQDANGRTPFLFPGRFKEYAALHAESGLHEYDLQPPASGIDIAGTTLTYPTQFRDGQSASGLFLVDSARANELIADSGFRVAEVAPGRGLLAITGVHYTDTDCGEYDETAQAFFVVPVGSHRRVPYMSTWAEILRGRAASFTWKLQVTTGLSQQAGLRMWGFPKTIEDITFERANGTAGFRLRMDGQDVFRYSVPDRGSRAPAPVTSAVYSIVDGRPHVSHLTQRYRDTGYRFLGGELELGEHRMADELRALGVGRRALLASWNGSLAFSMTAPTALAGTTVGGRQHA